jgi:pimeloyl-ACP methyl ester carboxylesterase
VPPRTLPWEGQYQVAGQGPDHALLIGGFGAGPANLRPLALGLRAQGLSVTVSALGRHTGDEALFRTSRTWHYYADALRLLRRVAAVARRPVLLGGYSTGALVAVLLAARHPNLVSALVLVSPVLRTSKTSTQLVGYSFGSLYYLGLPLAAAGTALALSAGIRRHGWRHRLLLRALGTAAVLGSAAFGLRSITVPLRSGGPMVLEGEEVVPAHFARASLVTGSTLVPLQVVARRLLEDVIVPTCGVFGGADDVVDVEFGVDLIARVRGSEVHVVTGAPHRVVATPECVDLVAGFARRVLGASPAIPAPRWTS